MLELYHWEPNTFSLKPLIALHEKHLEFTSRYVDFLSLTQYGLTPFESDQEARCGLEGEWPVLVHDGAVISDSFFINLYLDEAFAAIPLQPADAEGRWRVQVWGRFIGEVLAPAVCTLGCARYLVPALQQRDREALAPQFARIALKERRDEWQAALGGAYSEAMLADSRRKTGIAIQRIEDALGSSDWLAGPAYSLADIEAFALTNALPDLVPELASPSAAPRFAAWRKRMLGRPAVQSALAMSRTGKPEHAFAPGPEHPRWG